MPHSTDAPSRDAEPPRRLGLPCAGSAPCEAFRNWAASLPELLDVFVVSGTNDFLLHVAVPNTDALYAFVIDRLTERPEVADVNTSIVYEHIRRAVLEPLENQQGSP